MKQQYAIPQRGFSIIEAVVVLTIIMIVMGFAILGLTPILRNFKANSAMDGVIGQLRLAREMAISKRRNIEVAFINPNQTQLTPETPAGAPVLPSPYSVIPLEGGSQFKLLVGPDTPMGFGNGAAISFNALGAAPVLPLRFTTNGAFIDANNNPVNGTLFLGIPGQIDTARAVTILGATGRVRSYTWSRTGWTE